MKTYTVIFEVPDDYKPIREFISCWFKDSGGKDVSVTKALKERPKDYDSNGDIIPMSCKEEKEDVFTRKEELSKEESEWLIDFITKKGDAK